MKTIPASVRSDREVTERVTSTQSARKDKFRESRRSEKCDKVWKEGALKCLMIKGDPTLCTSCAAILFRAEVTPHRELHAVPVDTYVPESLDDAMYRSTLDTRSRILRLESPSGSIQDLLRLKKKISDSSRAVGK